MPDAAKPPETSVVAPLMDPAFIAECFQTEAPKVATPEASGKDATVSTADDKTPKDTPVDKAEKVESTQAPIADPVVEDLSDVAEILRAPLNAMSAEKRAIALKELRKGYLRQSQFTKLTTGIADKEKSAEAFDLAMKNPRLRKAWNEIMANPDASPTPDVSDEQEAETLAKLALEADGKGLSAFLKTRDARILAQAEERANAVYEKRAIEPGVKFKAVEAALEARIAETGLQTEAVREAVRKAIKYPGNGPIESWDPSKAWELIEPFIAAPTNTPAPAVAKPPIPKVAPPGRGASASAPAPLPAHRREGRPPKNNSEEAEEFATLLSEALGREISVADLDRVS